MKNKQFLQATGVRALRTACQVAIGAIGSASLIDEVNWMVVLSTVALSTILSVLNSIATGLPEVSNYEDIEEE